MVTILLAIVGMLLEVSKESSYFIWNAAVHLQTELV